MKPSYKFIAWAIVFLMTVFFFTALLWALIQSPALAPAPVPTGYVTGDPIPPSNETGFQTGDTG